MTYSRMTHLVEMSIRYWVVNEEKHRIEEEMPVAPQNLRDFSDSDNDSQGERKIMPCNAVHCPICEASGVSKVPVLVR